MDARLAVVAIVVAFPTHPATRPPDTSLWFDLGHRVIARIAEQRLSSQAARAVREILGGQSMADASLWADQIRGRRRDTAPLHYVNIPLQAESYDSARDCSDGRCVIVAIQQDRRVLSDPAATAIDRGEALRFLIHFVGDLHQPLHVADNGDRGGNSTQVQLSGRGMNLHQVWDGELIRTAWPDEQSYFDHLAQQMATMDVAVFEQGTVVDWAMEGHRIAAEHAYQVPGDQRLENGYAENNLPLVDLAIIKAGVRLAKILNDDLAEYQPGAPAPTLGPGTYSDREAAAHAGEEATVVGTVVSVHHTDSGNLYLNFGADYPRQTFSGAVLNPRDPALRDLDRLAGTRIAIHGIIKLYNGQAEIVIERAEQIQVAPQ